MEIHTYSAFVVATTIMIALPGPSVLLTVAHSISLGWQRALITVAGATMGIAVQLFIASIGLASLLNVVADVFDWLRWAGAGYLVYLGVRQWRSTKNPLALVSSTVSKKNIFVQGLVVTTFNPKSLLFIAAFLPQFIDAARPLEWQFALIVPTFLMITFSVTSAWALIAGKIGGLVQNHWAIQSLLRTTGGMMILTGASLMLARRAN